MSDLEDRFPNLFFDIKTVEQKTPLPQLPSMAQVLGQVLIENGNNNPGLAANLAAAAEQLVSLRDSQSKTP